MVEKIFAIPGLGQWMIHSINGRDYPMIMGLTIFFSTFLMISMFLVDIVYSLLDPRIRLARRRPMHELGFIASESGSASDRPASLSALGLLFALALVRPAHLPYSYSDIHLELKNTPPCAQVLVWHR